MMKIRCDISKFLLLVFLTIFITGCVSTIVGGVVETAATVTKATAKAGRAVVDAVTPDLRRGKSKTNDDEQNAEE